jgi:hypothetical protein
MAGTGGFRRSGFTGRGVPSAVGGVFTASSGLRGLWRLS